MAKNLKIILTAIAITAIASLFGASSYLSMSTPALAQQTVPEGPQGDGDGETNDDNVGTTQPTKQEGPQGDGDGETNDDFGTFTSDSWTNQKPVITGTVNVGDATKNFINENKKVSFVEAATSAEKQVQNGSVVEGELDVKQGYLVYSFRVLDTQSDISYKIIIDAGDGKVLYKSEGMSPKSHGMHEFGDNEK